MYWGRESRVWSGYLLLILAITCWAGNAVIGRAAAESDIPPLALNFWRWVTALCVFIPFFGKQTWLLWPEIRANLPFIICFALISVVAYNCTLYISLQTTSALQASLIQSILPVLVLLLCLFILKTPVTARQWLGVIFSILGAFIIILRGDLEVLVNVEVREGDWWALVAVSLWAIQAFVMRWKPNTIPIMPFMTILGIIGVAIMAPLYILESATHKPMPFNSTSLSMIAYAGVVASVGGTTMWNEGTWRAGAAHAGYFGNLYPLFAGGLAILILGESLEWYHLTGAVFVLTGIWLAVFDRKGNQKVDKPIEKFDNPAHPGRDS